GHPDRAAGWRDRASTRSGLACRLDPNCGRWISSVEFERALVVEDQAPTRDWLSSAVQLAFPEARIEHADTLAAGLLACDPPPPLALVDLGLPDGSGIELSGALQRRGAPTLCIVVTVFDDDGRLFPALRAGARGYLLKD